VTLRPARRLEGTNLEPTTRRGVGLALGLGQIRYEVCGAAEGPVVVVLGGISASRHVTRNALDETPGWWETTVGPGRAIDTNRFCVVGIDFLTALRAVGGQPTQPRTVTTFDQAHALEVVLDAIGVRRVRAIVGASYGGMVALAFAAHVSQRVERIVVISAAHQSDPMATTLRAIQRRIVRLSEAANAPQEGLALARALAMTTYRTRTEFSARFHNEPNLSGEHITFPAEEYVIARGEDYAGRTLAKDFCALTLSLDLHVVTPESIRVPTTLIGVVEDQLVPIERIRELHRRLAGSCRLIELSSLFGHDAFLKDGDRMASCIVQALEGTSIAPTIGRIDDRAPIHARAALGQYVDEANGRENLATHSPRPA
jgi:homoserine O-acetyltransferase